MARNPNIDIKITADAGGAVTGLNQAAAAVDNLGQSIPKIKDTLDDVTEILQDTGNAAETAAQKMVAAAEREDAALRQAATAAEFLRDALGDTANNVDVGKVVSELNRMGVSMNDIVGDADRVAAALKQIDNIQLRRMQDFGRASGDLDRMGASARRAAGDVDRLRNNSDQTRSVMANLAGNAAQDLGELGAVAGTAGVAIGQLAEYAVDGNIQLSQLAKFVGPMLALGIGVSLVTKAFGDMKKDAAELKAITEGTAEAFAELTGVAEIADANIEGVGATSQQTGSALDDLSASFYKFKSEGDDGIENISKINSALGELGFEAEELALLANTMSLAEMFSDADVGTEKLNELGQAARDVGLDIGGFEGQVLEAVAASDGWGGISQNLINNLMDTGMSFNDASKWVETYRDEIEALEELDDQGLGEFQKFAGESLDQIAASSVDATVEIAKFREEYERLNNTEPLDTTVLLHMMEWLESPSRQANAWQQLFKTWDSGNDTLGEGVVKFNQLAEAADKITDGSLQALYDDMEDGNDFLGGEALGTLIKLRDAFPGKSEAEILEMVAENFEETTEAAAELTPEMEAAVDAIVDYAKEVAEASDELQEFADEFDNLSSRADAFAQVIDGLRDPLESFRGALSNINNTEEIFEFKEGFESLLTTIGEAGDALDGQELIPDDWNEVVNFPEELKPVFDSISELADLVDGELADAFTVGGAGGVREFATQTRTALTQVLTDAGLTTTQIEEILTALGLMEEQVEITIALSREQEAMNVLDDIDAQIEKLSDEVQIRITTLALTDPIAALQMAIDEMQLAGIEVPVELQSIVDLWQAEQQAAQAAADGDPIKVPIETKGDVDAKEKVEGAAADQTAYIDVQLRGAEQARSTLDQLDNPRYQTTYIQTSAGRGGYRAMSNAMGTNRAQPGWSWVGEEGPELIKLEGGEKILSNPQSMDLLNAGMIPGYAHGTGDFFNVIQYEFSRGMKKLLAEQKRLADIAAADAAKQNTANAVDPDIERDRLRAFQYERDSNEKTYLAYLQTRLKQEKVNSKEYVEIWREIKDITGNQKSELEALADAAQKKQDAGDVYQAFLYEVQSNETSYLKYLNTRLKQEKRNSDEWMEIYKEIREVTKNQKDEAADKKQAAIDAREKKEDELRRVRSAQNELGFMSDANYIKFLQQEQTKETPWSEDWVALALEMKALKEETAKAAAEAKTARSGGTTTYSAAPVNAKVSGTNSQTSTGLRGTYISFYADGTDWSKAGLAMVGEEGPELVQLNAGSKVFTSKETKKMVDGTAATINNYYNVVHLPIGTRDARNVARGARRYVRTQGNL